MGQEKRETVAIYGKYVVLRDPLAHRPYGLYRIYCQGRHLGAQLSFPSQSDCEWIEAKAGKPNQYADSSTWIDYSAGRRIKVKVA